MYIEIEMSDLVVIESEPCAICVERAKSAVKRRKKDAANAAVVLSEKDDSDTHSRSFTNYEHLIWFLSITRSTLL